MAIPLGPKHFALPLIGRSQHIARGPNQPVLLMELSACCQQQETVQRAYHATKCMLAACVRVALAPKADVRQPSGSTWVVEGRHSVEAGALCFNSPHLVI